MNQESQSAKDKMDQEQRKWVSQLVFPVLVAALGAVLVTALTPLGTSLRDFLFHTKATVTGSVTLDGKPAASVHLKLDGADGGNTDSGGRFLLADVSKGQHRLRLDLLGAQPRDEAFTVAGGQTALQVGNLEMEPLVQLGYTSSAGLAAQKLDYDVTLWIIGDPDVLNRIKSVSYTLPTSLSTRPVSGASVSRAFCYRQTGSLSLQGGTPLGNGPIPASATVDLGAGQKFQISAPPGSNRPPGCPAHQAAMTSQVSTTPAESQPASPPSSQPASPPTSSGAPQTDVPSVIGDSQQTASQVLTTAGFEVGVKQGSGRAQYANGTVFGQTPQPDHGAPPGSTVTIYVQNAASPSATASTSGH